MTSRLGGQVLHTIKADTTGPVAGGGARCRLVLGPTIMNGFRGGIVLFGVRPAGSLLASGVLSQFFVISLRRYSSVFLRFSSFVVRFFVLSSC